MENIVNENYNEAVNYVSKPYKSKISATVLENLWKSVVLKKGKCESHELNCFQDGTNKNVFITLKFSKESFDAKIPINSDYQVIGIYFVKVQDDCSKLLSYHEPRYDKQKYLESNFEFNSDGVVLYGTKLTPFLDKKIHCIFIHGSGAQDRDCTIGANKLFRDLAVGLANYGITSYRYDKRTYTYKVKDSSLTVDKEVTNDALQLIYEIHNRALKGSKIFVVGHSLGAAITPRIVEKSEGKVNGAICLASNARPLYELIIEQLEYIINLDGKIDQDERIFFEKITTQVGNLKAGKRKNLPFEQSYSYWNSLIAYNQIETAKSLNVPMLFLQGERDYQVTMKDHYLWQNHLKGEQVSFKSFKKLNHIFLEGVGKSTPSEYTETSKNVPYYVIKVIGKWIMKQ